MRSDSTHMRLLSCVLIALLAIVSSASCGAEAKHIGRLTVLVSGNTEGYLKNCGCSAGQFGGAGRMARMLEEEKRLAEKPQGTDHGMGNDVIMVDLGGIIATIDEVHIIESQAIVEIMKTLPYDSVGLGMKELGCRQDVLWKIVGESNLPFTAANIKFIAPKDGEDCSEKLNGIIKPYRIITRENGYRIGIIHVLDHTYVRMLNPDYGAQVSEAPAAISDIMQQHAKEADFWIVTVAEGVQKSKRAEEVRAIPGLGMIIGFDRYEAPKDATGKLPVFVEPSFHKARDISRAVIKFNAKGEFSTFKSDELELQESVSVSDVAQAILDAVQPKLEAEANRMAEQAGQHSGPHPWYIGATQCAVCHSDIVLQMQETKHIHAYETLVAKDQHRSAACLPCHVVGYDTPDRGGFNIFEKDPLTLGVRCESCHGPGEYHVAVQSGKPAPADLKDNGRDQFGLLPLKLDDSACIKCHDPLNSVGFSFKKYWPLIQHGNGLSPDLTIKLHESASGGMQGSAAGSSDTAAGQASTGKAVGH
jgi:hypothetical protein